jgi:hypothetical protein
VTSVHFPGVHICSFTRGIYSLRVPSGEVFRFEFSDQFGPGFIDRRGGLDGKRPPLRSPFWKALQWWCQQGHRCEGDKCLYDVPAPGRWLQINNSNYIVDTPEQRTKFPWAEPFESDPWTERLSKVTNIREVAK